jgi:hypothetical protein
MKKIAVVFLLLSVLTNNIFSQISSKIDMNNLYAGEVTAIISGTIFDVFVFDLNQYNTELKKKAFLQTPDSRIYLQRLEDMKNHILQNGIKSNIAPSHVRLSDYDMSKQGFWLTIGTNFGSGTGGAFYKNVINGFLYEKLTVFEEKNRLHPNFLTYKIFLAVDESNAIRIEGNKNIKIIMEMEFDNFIEKSFTFYTFSGRTYSCKETYPNVRSLKLSLFDEKTKAIHSEHLF